MTGFSLKWVCAAVLCLLPLVNRAADTVAGAKSDSRPNILYCLADDWSWPHAGAYGDPVVKTPAFDRVAREGALFSHCFSAAPSCSPSRAAMLTGQAPHRLAEGANLWGTLNRRYPVYPNLLEKSGYAVGYVRKGWGPGDFTVGGRTRNPAGPNLGEFKKFIKTVPEGKPFCFWFGSHQPHRPYQKGSGLAAGLDPAKVIVPPMWPDTPEVRSDILDYYFNVQRFDRDVDDILQLLEAQGKLDNTIVVMSGDNGWPFPRGKANLYDAGTRQPLAVRWPGKIKAGQKFDDYILLTDLAPTFLEAAGLKPLPEMTGHSFLNLVTGQEKPGLRTTVFIERERHANARKDNLGYPSRAIRTTEFLYIRNYEPDRWPGGDPERWVSVGQFGDTDASPTKDAIVNHRTETGVTDLFHLSYEKRPFEELYEIKTDPNELTNVAGRVEFSAQKKKLIEALDKYLKETADPRAEGKDGGFDKVPYYGTEPKL